MNHEFEIFEMQAQLCQSLGHAVRLRIVHLLKEGPKSVNEIAKMVGVSQPTSSRHLSILRSNGILMANRKGSEVYYSISNPKIVEVCEMMRAILTERQSQYFDILNSLND